MNVTRITSELWSAYSSIPWLAAFLVSLVSNAIPYTTVPYLFLIAYSSAALQNLDQKIAVIVSAGLGAALGKMLVFLLGRTAHAALPDNVRRNMELFARLIKKWGALAVFLFAALPLPDDVLYIPLGVAGFNPLLFFLAVVAGKIIITSLAVLMGDVIATLSGAESVFDPRFIAAMVAFSIYISVLIARVNWMKVAEAMQKGWGETLSVLMKEVARAALPVRTR